MSPDINWLSYDGARELAMRIIDYWLERDVIVRVWVAEVGLRQHQAPVYGIRSNLGLYLPPRREHASAQVRETKSGEVPHRVEADRAAA